MQIKISFDTDAAAFEEVPQKEIARILDVIGQRILNEPTNSLPSFYMNVYDINGNRVGSAVVK